MGEFKNGTIGMTSGKITTCLYRRKEENKQLEKKQIFKDKIWKKEKLFRDESNYPCLSASHSHLSNKGQNKTYVRPIKILGIARYFTQLRGSLGLKRKQPRLPPRAPRLLRGQNSKLMGDNQGQSRDNRDSIIVKPCQFSSPRFSRRRKATWPHL